MGGRQLQDEIDGCSASLLCLRKVSGLHASCATLSGDPLKENQLEHPTGELLILRLRAPDSVINKEFEEPFAQLLPGHLNIIRGLESQRNAGLIARSQRDMSSYQNQRRNDSRLPGQGVQQVHNGYQRRGTYRNPPVCFL